MNNVIANDVNKIKTVISLLLLSSLKQKLVKDCCSSVAFSLNRSEHTFSPDGTCFFFLNKEDVNK